MKKGISSIFILLLLGLTIWGASAWHLGTKTEDYIASFIENTKQNTQSLFDFELLGYERSIFNSKAQIKLNINTEHNIARFFEGSINDLNDRTIQIDILHGPLLFNPKGVGTGSSAWTFGTDQPINQEANEVLFFDKLANAKISINFENILTYKIPFELNELFVTGFYDLKTANHQGRIQSNELKFESTKQTVITKQAELQYYQLDINNNEKIQFKLTGDLPKIRYGFNLFPEGLTFKGNYKGDFTFEKNVLNVYSQLLFDMTEEDKLLYPIEKGDLRFKVNDLNLDSLWNLHSELSEVKNLQEQAQWILEEQGEFPEGQDQIWQLQDREARYFNKLPQLVNDLIFAEGENKSVNGTQNIKDASIRFYLKTEYNNEDSSINGAVYPSFLDTDFLDASFLEKNNLDVSALSLSSLIHPQAQVKLNNDWLAYLSTRFPITKNDFTLTYKQNQLLMQ